MAKVLTYAPMGKFFFLSETRTSIEPKMYMSSHWMVHYKILILLFLQDCFTCCYEHQKKFWMAFVQYTKRPRKGLLLKENLAIILSNWNITGIIACRDIVSSIIHVTGFIYLHIMIYSDFALILFTYLPDSKI